MPQARRRTARRSSRGVPWVWLLVLVLLVGAVAAARTMGRPATPVAATPTPLATPVAAQQVHTPIIVPTATVAARRVVVAATATPIAAARPTSTAAATREGRPVAATVAPTATRVAERVTPSFTPTAGTTHVGELALTFDAGADRGYAEDILDTLQQEHVVASFGITGLWAKANPDLVRRMAADGHLVFNHTYDHRSFTGLSDQLGGLTASERRSELEQADAIIAPLIGHSTEPYYRLPYGDDDARVGGDVQPAGYTRKIGWTVDSLGWKGLQSTDILARCLKLATPGAVYVFHVGRESQDPIALPQLIRTLRDKGFSFRRVDQS